MEKSEGFFNDTSPSHPLAVFQDGSAKAWRRRDASVYSMGPIEILERVKDFQKNQDTKGTTIGH